MAQNKVQKSKQVFNNLNIFHFITTENMMYAFGIEFAELDTRYLEKRNCETPVQYTYMTRYPISSYFSNVELTLCNMNRWF